MVASAAGACLGQWACDRSSQSLDALSDLQVLPSVGPAILAVDGRHGQQPLQKGAWRAAMVEPLAP